jgi:predicted Rossmann fold nucleotide-binding protein DprA/Smf involved in DNA uptake
MPTTIDNLVCDTKLPISELISILSMLEINGYIKSLPGRQYVINAK